MAVMQKMKGRCADLEREVESVKEQYKNNNNSSEDSTLIQELTERMDALLLEKAETQQSLFLSRKDLEKAKQQAKGDLLMLQGELDRVREDHQREFKSLESRIEESNSKHQEEVACFQKILKEREEDDRESERERERAKVSTEEVRLCLESQLETLRAELEATHKLKAQGIGELQESHQRELTETQQEVENLKEELAQKTLQHEDEMRALEEDCEIERERLLLLHEELTEQLALKDSYLQDVQEEDEDPARGSGIAKMLELSACSQGDSSHGDGDETETGRLRAALDELQSQSTMLQDELTLLSNVKSELEAELEKAKDEFQMEKEELEFKINELQMNRESAPSDPSVTRDPDQQEVSGDFQQQSEAHKDGSESAISPVDQNPLDPEGLRAQCDALTRERDSAVNECQHMRDILQGVETELGEKTTDFIFQSKAMKEQGVNTVRELQEQMEQLSQERDELLVRVADGTEEQNTLMKNLQDLRLKLEGFADGDQKLQSSVEEQTRLACELKQSVEELTRQNVEILSQLQLKEHMTQELREMVNALTAERDEIQAQLQHREEEMQKQNNDRTKEIDGMLQEKENEALLHREENEKDLKSLKREREKMEESLKEEVERRQETVSAFELTIKELSTEKADLQRELEEASSGLSEAWETRELLGSKLASLEAQLEQETSEKNRLEAKLSSLAQEADQARPPSTALEENHSEVLKISTEEVEELRARVDELQREGGLLRSSLEEARGAMGLEEVVKDLQARIADLEQERSMLRNNLEEVVKDTEGLQNDLEEMKSFNEKFNEENQRLQAHISELTQEREEKEEEELERGMEKESKELKDQLTEKDSLVSQLRSEIAALQESAAQAASSEENAASEITKKIALLEKEHKEKDGKMNKIKAVAIKAKKELETRKKEVALLKKGVESLKAEREKVSSSMKDIIHGAEGYRHLQIDYDRQTEQLDEEREKVEEAERRMAELTKRLSSAVTQTETLSSEKENLLACMETTRSTVRQLEAQNQELQRQSTSLDRDLLTERAMKEQKMKDLSSATKEVEELTAQLRKQQQQSQQTAQELGQLRKGAQQSSLLDMEMADYERLVKELNVKLLERDECAEKLKAQINTLTQKEDSLKQEIEALKSQLDQGEEKTFQMKQLLVKTKKDLADAKMQESSLMMLQASLKGELEANQQQLENTKIEMCELTGERHRLQEQQRSALEQQQRTNSSLQLRINILQQERDAAKTELMSTTGEFDGYKVRVHNVLKQQKSKTAAQSEGDSGKLEREQLSSRVEQLRSRLAESQQSLQSSTAELQQLQTEHDTLMERHNKILQDAVSKEAELRERLLSVQSENVALRSDVSQAQSDLSSQVEAQRHTYREQLRKLQDDHGATVETLQGQLTRVEEQLFYLQSQNSSVAIQSGRKSLTSDPQRRNMDQNQAGLGMMILSDPRSMAREEGEGMETTETESPSSALSPLPSLEQLLASPDPKQEPFVWTVEPTKEELSVKLSTATRGMDHMNSLLHETEATNAVLMEQITLLKSEVRRLERNQEREKSVANLEYLKNVLLQFIFLQSGSERQTLLPVIHTMLQLSPEEKSKLAAIAHGQEEGSGSRGSGWSSYLHSWSGIR